MTPTIFESERGLPSLRYGAEALEDPVDPRDGARLFVRPEQLARADHVVVFGVGLGYRLRRLEELGCEAPLVFEPCPEALALAREHGPGVPPGARVFTELAELHAALLSRSRPHEHTVLLAAPPYARAFPQAHQALVRLIDEVQGLVILRRNSVAERSALLVERALSNLPRLAAVPTLDRLGQPLDGVPAFVVSAGPSLDRNRDRLAAAARRGAVLAVNTSAPAVAAAGAPIDLLVAIEALDVSEPMKLAAPVTRALALDLTAGGANFEVDVARKLAFCVDTPQYAALAAELGIDTLGYGGSVATAAFAVAARLGADPIVLVGQDLAYTDGRGYASDTLFGETRVHRAGDRLVIERVAKWEEMTRAGGLRVPSKVRPCVEVPAWGGGTVNSTHELTLFRRWFEMAARELKGRRRLVDATEGGASIAGFEEVPLRALLEELPERAHGLHAAIDAAAPLEAERVHGVARAVARRSEQLAKAAKRCVRASKRGDRPKVARASREVSAAAKEAPLAEAHAAPALMAVLDDETLSDDARELRTYGAIRRSAARVAEGARAAARDPSLQKRLKR